MNIEDKLRQAGAVKTSLPCARDAWKLDRKYIWIIPGDNQNVLVGYAHSPEQQGVTMKLSTALRL